MQLSAQSVDVLIKSADIAFVNQNFTGAAELYKRALNKDESNVKITYKLANSYHRNRDYQLALNEYKKILNSDASAQFSDLFFEMADCAKSLGYYLLANEYYTTFAAKNLNNNGYATLKAFHEAEVCKHLTDSSFAQFADTIEIQQLPTNINSPYSEMSVFAMNDSLLYFSVYKPLKKNLPHVSVIEKTEMRNNTWQNPELLGNLINIENKNVSSYFLDSESNIVYFTVCENSLNGCKIYRSVKKNDEWQTAEMLQNQINTKGYNSTHLTVAKMGGVKFLLFTSDREDGKGGFDVWRSEVFADNSYGISENLGDSINTMGNEISPSFDSRSKTLYFSSNWHTSLGGFDVFRASYTEGIFSEISNLGQPINSKNDELYFTYSQNGSRAWFISNRSSAISNASGTCCNDIYSYSLVKQLPPPVDSVPLLADIPIVPLFVPLTDTLTSLLTLIENIPTDSLQLYLPRFEVFFDNDQPLPRSFATKTSLAYDSIYHRYIQRKGDYYTIYTKGKTDSTLLAADTDLKQLFHAVETGYYNVNY